MKNQTLEKSKGIYMISFENSEADAHGGFCDRGGLEI